MKRKGLIYKPKWQEPPPASDFVEWAFILLSFPCSLISCLLFIIARESVFQNMTSASFYAICGISSVMSLVPGIIFGVLIRNIFHNRASKKHSIWLPTVPTGDVTNVKFFLLSGKTTYPESGIGIDIYIACKGEITYTTICMDCQEKYSFTRYTHDFTVSDSIAYKFRPPDRGYNSFNIYDPVFTDFEIAEQEKILEKWRIHQRDIALNRLNDILRDHIPMNEPCPKCPQSHKFVRNVISKIKNR
ncbi:MAG: hypothetical protein FVQ83_10780 [Chloroflexi bacterium]|nr:hypothetical protein [Chloroflexota bacterium]